MNLTALQWALIAGFTVFFTVYLVGEFLIGYWRWRNDPDRPLSEDWRAPK